MNIRYLLTLVLAITHLIVTAQISVKSIPVSFKTSLSEQISTIEIPNIVPKLNRMVDKGPKQAGYTLPFNHHLSNNGNWEKSENIFVWRLEIIVPTAKSINIYFNNLNLLPDDKLYMYNNSRDKLLGAFTNFNNGQFMCTDFIPGSRIIIELNSPTLYEQLPFSIREIGILYEKCGYRDFGNAGNCEVHINCDEGKNWQFEKDGVARILVKQNSSTFWCTGSLINNTKNDGKPLFLTANHCGEYADADDYAQWLFYFNYESANCEQPVFEPELVTLSGSDMLSHATSGTTLGSDFKLLLLKDDVPPNYKPYYNGWDISGEASPTGVTIHHPQGDLKMISTYESSLISTNYNSHSEDSEGKYWKVIWNKTITNHGVTEGGSSGSPIFNNGGYIVGALTGGFASCSNLEAPDYYGKISYSWNPINSDSTNQLSYWLDPTSSGVSFLKGTNLDSTNIFAGFSGEPKAIIKGESVTFINTSYGNINSHNWYFEGGDPEFSELEEPGSIVYNKAGEFDVRLIVSSAAAIDTIIAKDYIQVLPSISPNPSPNGQIKIAFGSTLPEDVINSIRIFNATGKETGYRIIEKSDNYLVIEITSKAQGLYLIKVSTEEINNTFKVIVY